MGREEGEAEAVPGRKLGMVATITNLRAYLRRGSVSISNLDPLQVLLDSNRNGVGGGTFLMRLCKCLVLRA
jgi:hypothetical protein